MNIFKKSFFRYIIIFNLIFISVIPLKSGAQTIHQDQIASGKVGLIDGLLEEFSIDEVVRLVSDSRLFLDESVASKGATGTGFDYFSEEYGLTAEKAISDGLKYRSKNWSHLRKAYAKYGTESYYILGILRLETYFGQYKGRRSVANTLYSIYVQDPSRRNFAIRELKSHMKLSLKNRSDLFAINGSTAGAFGIPQFIPSSALAFGVDGNGDRKIDLYNNADAIMSVGNYLKKNGWGKTEEEKSAAIFAYNHDEGYVNAVMAYAAAMEAEVNMLLSGR